MGSIVSSIAGPVLGGALSVFGAGKQAEATKAAANTSADAQVRAAQIAADASRFTPVGVTTGFGSSNFGYDETGRLTSAGYTLTPELQALRNQMLSQAGASNTQQLGQAAQPLYSGASSMFGLAGQLMPTSTDRRISPEAQALAQRYSGVSAALMPSTFETNASPAAQAYAENLRQMSLQLAPKTYDTRQAANTYMTEQQAVLEASRNQQMAALRNQLAQTGRSGLALGGDGNMQAANPEMAAYYNSLQQQNRELAAQATDVARNRLFQDVQASAGLQGQALTSEQQAQAIARNNMLQNVALSLGYGTEGYNTQVSGENLARGRFAEDLGLAQGMYSGGAGLLGQISPLTTAGYAPLQTQLGLAGSIEGMGQGAMDIGTAIGARTTSAAQAGAAGLLGAQTSAARTIQAANQYSPWGAALTGAGQQIASSGSQLGSWFNNMLQYGGTPQGGYAQQNQYLASLPTSGGTQQQQMLAEQNIGLFNPQ